MDGAHQLHAKGAVSYREQNNVPLIIAHPAYAGGKQCRAVTSHVDIAPTLIGLTGAASDKRAGIVKGLPGTDLSGLLAAPERADFTAVRDGALFNYNMLAYLDGISCPKPSPTCNKAANRTSSRVRASGQT